jgi:class 3 adenylate cyclase
MAKDRPSSAVDLDLFEKVQLKQRAWIPAQPEQVVALYVDILGFKKLVDLSLRDWVGAITRVQNIERWLRMLYQVNVSQNAKGLVTRVFSDNVYASFPLVSSATGRIATLLTEFLWTVGLIQCSLAQTGIFVRGGIAIGSQYVSETTLFGTALVRAYLCEQRAKNPRIVIDDSFLTYWSGAIPKQDFHRPGKRGSKAAEYPYVKRDRDGESYLDYMKVFEKGPSPEFVQEVLSGMEESHFTRNADIFIRMHKRQIVKGAKEAQDISVLRKYRWAARYHNSHVKNEDDLIEMKNGLLKKF